VALLYEPSAVSTPSPTQPDVLHDAGATTLIAVPGALPPSPDEVQPTRTDRTTRTEMADRPPPATTDSEARMPNCASSSEWSTALDSHQRVRSTRNHP